MKKKSLVSILTLSMAISLLSGCGGGSAKKNDGSTTGNSANETTETSDGEVVEITFMGWEASPMETKAVEDGIAEFEKQNPNIKVNYTPAGKGGSDYNAKMIASAAAGSLPDVLFVASDTYRDMVARGAIEDLTDMFDSELSFDDYIESSKQIMEVDGRVYGLHSCTVSPIAYYNKDVFDAAGIKYPSADPADSWTIEEFRDIAKKLTTDDIYGCYGLENVADTLNAQLLSNNGKRYNDDYTKSIINSPENKEVLKTIKEIRTVDKSMPDATTLDSVGMTSKQMLQTGKVAILIDGSWSMQELADTGMNVGIAPMPSYARVTTTGQAHVHSISTTSKHKEEAWKFLKFLAGYDYLGAVCHTGLWMPNRISFYKEENLDKWMNPDIHGEDYKLMLNYFKDAEVDPSALQKTAKGRDIVIEETDMYFKQDQDLDQTLENIDRRINEAIQENLEDVK